MNTSNDTDEVFLGDRFRILGCVGNGATSKVLHAEDVVLKRSVAIKVPHRNKIVRNPSLRKLFLKEAKFLASLDHPAVLPLFDYFDSSIGPVLVMRYVESALHRVPAEELRQPVDIINITKQIGSSLDYCVSQGMAHRDIKPDNILLDENGFVYLTDFGLAALLDEDAKWERIVGTPPFVCPELLFEQKLGPSSMQRERSDQFSFGALLYNVLTGHLPFEETPTSPCPKGWELCTALRLWRGERLTPCSEQNPRIPVAMDDVILQMLSIDPANRFPTNMDAAEQVAAALEGRALKSVNVFVSYFRGDQHQVAQIVEHLRNAGISVWWDRDVLFGTDWDDQIEEAMVAADVMLLFLSAGAIRSAESKREWKYWLNHIKKTLIPVVLQECRIPYRLSTLQRLDGELKKMNELVDEICSNIWRLTKYQQTLIAQPPPSVPETELERGYFKDVNLHSLSPGALDSMADVKTEIPGRYQLHKSLLQKYIR